MLLDLMLLKVLVLHMLVEVRLLWVLERLVKLLLLLLLLLLVLDSELVVEGHC